MCIKKEAAKGVCTISSVSNAVRQDWLACPYRALGPELLQSAIRRLYSIAAGGLLFTIPAIRLADEAGRELVRERLGLGERVFIYFDAKLGGELSIPATEKSPEFSFDVTIFELHMVDATPYIGRFAVLEIQTIDFHGSYASAVKNLRDALRMFPTEFGIQVQRNQQWLSDRVEGPNIANVFKRTFYQMMFKFQLGRNEKCAGCVLAIPVSVWDSWERHLAGAPLVEGPDGTFSLFKPGSERPAEVPAWIFVFDIDAVAPQTPKPLAFPKIIATDALSFSYFALEAAPAAALANVATEAGLLGRMARRMREIWPELAATIEF